MQTKIDPSTPRPGRPIPASQPSPEDQAEPGWDPAVVERLINEAYRRGDTPVALCLGRNQARALQAYLARYFSDDAPICLRGFVYAGLKLITLRPKSLLRVETQSTIRTEDFMARIRHHKL